MTAPMHKYSWKRTAGNAVCLMAFALFANVLVTPALPLSEKHLEVELAAAGAGLGLGLLWLSRRQDQFRSPL